MHSFQEYLQQGNAWLYIPAAIVLGALHGLEPGHSKTMMAAFIVAIRGTVKQAVLLGVSATLSHTAIIWVLALVGLHYSGRMNIETTEPYFQCAAGVIVIGMAAWMFFRIRRDQSPAHHHGHDHAHSELFMLDLGHGSRLELSVFEEGVPPVFRIKAPGSHRLPAARDVTLETVRPDGTRQVFQFAAKENFLESTSDIPEPHEFDATVTVGHGNHHHSCRVEFREDQHHHHHSHDHEDGEDFEDAHEREHAEQLERRFAGRSVTNGQLVLFGLTGGLMPCPAAFTVLVVCLQLKQFTLGFALVLAFSVGLAITLVTVGSVAALSVHHATKRFKGLMPIARKLPYASAAVMAMIGVFLALQGLKHWPH